MDKELPDEVEDDQGELYVMTTANRGPSGTTGRVWRIVSSREE